MVFLNTIKGVRIKPHFHKNIPKKIREVQEVLHIVYCRIEAEFFENMGKKIGSVILESDDTILLLTGGHGFDILRDAKILEIKQGLYSSVKEDKKFFDLRMKEG